ncbi:monooxygenase [Colletotrichum cereale]|nr:monooxygenase [Colletotrichum cereale]
MSNSSVTKVTRSRDRDSAEILSLPVHSERHVRVICVGAGPSGLLMAHELQRHFQKYSLQCYEKNLTTPTSCACDVPSHNYTWSFEPKLDWKYSLYQYIKLQRKNSQNNGYDVQVKDTMTGEITIDNCDVLINAGGILNNWKWPAIPGLSKYKGVLLHTANWDESVSVEDKRVGLIGNGSSGIQVLPAIREKCEKLITFVRDPTWVSPVQGLEQHEFSPEERREFDEKPDTLLEYRKSIEPGLNGQFGLFLKNSKINEDVHAYFTQQMKDKLRNPYLESKLIPEWRVGCRRLTPGVNYLESLTEPNVEVVYGKINEITEPGCFCTNGQEYAVEVLICATGFDTSFRLRFPVDKSAVNPQSYFGVAAAGFPNYFLMLGPNCPVGNRPVLSAIEAQADWILKVIDRYQTTNIAEFAPKKEAVCDFVGYKEQFMNKTAIKEVRWDDLYVKYAGNRCAWLGSGYSKTELDDTDDWAYSIRDRDDDPPLTTAGKRRLLTKSVTVKGRKIVSYSVPADRNKEHEQRKAIARL